MWEAGILPEWDDSPSQSDSVQNLPWVILIQIEPKGQMGNAVLFTIYLRKLNT